MNRQPISSQLLKSIGYEDGVLEVEFAKGSVYRYDVPADAHAALMAAKSIGSHFLKEIKPKFPLSKAEREQ